MKKLIPILLGTFFLAFLGGCYSAQKSYERGDYDRAIQLSAKKLRKKPDDQKTIEILVNSWEISNRVDKDDLNAQLSGSNPDWEQVYTLYKKLDDRQRVVKQLPKLKPDNHKTNVDFVFEDYSSALTDAKQHAIQALTVKGDDFLSRGDRFSARTAYDYYNKAYALDNSNGIVKGKADQAYLMSFTHVLVQVAPVQQVSIPDNFTRQALDKKWTNLESGWLKLHNMFQGNFVYHYYTDVLINSVIVSPDRVVETSYVDTKKIEDGWEYVKNGDGSVRTDSAGNKLKQPVYRDITCTIQKYTMTKDATINGLVTIYGIDSDKKYANDAISSNYAFNYTYGTAKGDTRALSKTSQDLINRTATQFPTNVDVVMNASSTFGDAIYAKVSQYKSSFQ
jgi:tetratricopeptide (TPR) repeat protein